MDARYVVDRNGKRVGILLDVEEYARILEELEELEDIRAYDEAVDELERGEDRPVPLRETLPRIEAEREELRRRGEL